MGKRIVGVDIGGTTVKIGLFDWNGTIEKKWKVNTVTENNGQTIIKDIWDSIVDQVSPEEMESLAGIGLGAPGFVETKTGLIYEAANIGWKNMNLRDELQHYTDLPVFVENDANVAALGENWQGAGDNRDNLVVVTLGTGIGCGIITDGEILHGENGISGEFGHMIVDPHGHMCNCGRPGCLETICSATGISRLAIEKAKENPGSDLHKIYMANQTIKVEEVFKLMDDGNYQATAIIDHVADVLGLQLANLAVIFNPSSILLGGGVSGAGEPLLGRVEAAFKRYALTKVTDVCEIALATLGNDAGVIGSAFLVKQQLEMNH